MQQHPVPIRMYTPHRPQSRGPVFHHRARGRAPCEAHQGTRRCDLQAPFLTPTGTQQPVPLSKNMPFKAFNGPHPRALGCTTGHQYPHMPSVRPQTADWGLTPMPTKSLPVPQTPYVGLQALEPPRGRATKGCTTAVPLLHGRPLWSGHGLRDLQLGPCSLGRSRGTTYMVAVAPIPFLLFPCSTISPWSLGHWTRASQPSK